MSEQTSAAAPAATEEGIDLPPEGDAAFAALMDALAPLADAAAGTEGGAPAAAAPGGNGQPTPEGQGIAPRTGQPGAQAAGGAGVPAVAPAGAGGAGEAGSDTGAGDPGRTVDPTWTVDSGTLTDAWGEISTGIEEGALEEFKEAAFDEVKGEYEKYFEALELHPRQLVGETVPSIGKEGDETLRDSKDAEEWQAAVKQILTNEVRDRATRLFDDAAPQIATVHAAVELFQLNKDMVPFTKQFDRELADRFATLAKPYEVRVEGKLYGYQIPTQPLIEQIRSQLAAERGSRGAPAAAATAAPGGAATPAAGSPPAAVDRPQAGIPAKAGSGSEAEDFSTLFGTIGLPNLRI